MEEYIVDEGQDLWRCVHESLPNHCKRYFVSADDAQQVHSDRATVEEIEAAIKMRPGFHRYALDQNFRNTYEIYRFARQFQPQGNKIVWDTNTLTRLEHDTSRRGERPL